MTLGEFQGLIRDQFGAKDAERGSAGTFMWFVSEVGELAEAIRGNHAPEAIEAEFADVLAWLATLANIAGVDLDRAVARKYGRGCPECLRTPCKCAAMEKP